MVNVNKLLGLLKELGLSASCLTEPLGVTSPSSVYRKLENHGERLTIREATAIGAYLHLTSDQMNAIFFDYGDA